MDLELLRTFLGWCTLINFGLLMLSFGMLALAGGWVRKIHGRWFPMPAEDMIRAHYGMLGTYKILVIIFNVVPWIALTILTA